MRDIGFGMIDRRSVAAILFSIGLSIALGFNIPIDSSNVINLLGDAVLFTGALFLCRSGIRLILVIFSVMLIKRDDLRYSVIMYPDWISGLIQPLLKRVWYVFDYPIESARHANILRVIRFFDRLSLIGIVFFFGQSIVHQYFNFLGITGITIMLFIYVLRGNYTFLIRDAIDAESENNLHYPPDIKIESTWNG